MKRISHLRRTAMVLGAAGFVVIAAAWQTHSANTTHTTKDTVPERDSKVRNIDDALEELERGRLEVERTLRSTDWEKMQKDLQASMKDLRMEQEKMARDMERSLRDVDVNKIQREVDEALSKVDFEKMKKEIGEAGDRINRADLQKLRAEIDAQKIQADVQASLAKIDREKMKEEMEKVKSINLDEMRTQLEKIRPEVERSLADARGSIEKAKTELLAYREFINGLAKDGLIDKDGPYKIEYEDGVLSINGKKQPESVVNKYKAFLDKQKNFTLKKDEDSFDIQN